MTQSTSRLTAVAFFTLVAGCAGALDSPTSQGEGAGTPPIPAAASADPDIRQMVAPTHPDDQPWGLLASSSVTGRGACASTSLDAVLDRIRAQFDEVSGIQSFRSSGPMGVTMSAGAPVPLGEQPPPATGTSEYVRAFMDDRSFGIVFVRGVRCRGDVCEDRQHWYFETDDACRPRWVGHLRIVERAGGRFGRCVDVTGSSVWRFPGNPGARQRCDADWSAQNISGSTRAWSLDPLGTCSTIKDNIIPVEVTLSQGQDLSIATLVLHGTGIPFVDGKPFVGKVERQGFAATLNETIDGPCVLRREFKFNIDFEGDGLVAPPGFFGVGDLSQEASGSCAGVAAGCGASLHFMRRE